jgi:hypothetical protein
MYVYSTYAACTELTHCRYSEILDYHNVDAAAQEESNGS